MSQTSGFSIPMCRLHAGGDLSQPNHIYQCMDHTLMRSERQPKCLLHSPDLANLQIYSWRRPGVPSIIDIGAGTKSP